MSYCLSICLSAAVFAPFASLQVWCQPQKEPKEENKKTKMQKWRIQNFADCTLLSAPSGSSVGVCVFAMQTESCKLQLLICLLPNSPVKTLQPCNWMQAGGQTDKAISYVSHLLRLPSFVLDSLGVCVCLLVCVGVWWFFTIELVRGHWIETELTDRQFFSWSSSLLFVKKKAKCCFCFFVILTRLAADQSVLLLIVFICCCCCILSKNQ